MKPTEAQLLADIEDIIPEIGSRSKVYELLGEGKIKAVKIGTRTRIVMESFREYVAGLPNAKISPPTKRTTTRTTA